MGSVLKLGLGVQSKVRIGPGLGVRAKVKVGPDFRAKTTSTQSGQDRQVPSTSHRGRLPPCWGPRLIHGGSASLEVLFGLKPRGSWVEQIKVNGEVDIWRM